MACPLQLDNFVMLYLNSRVDVIDIGDAGISLNKVRSYTAQSVYLSQRGHNLIIDFLRRFHHNSPIELVLCLARCSRIGLFFRLCLETFKFHFNNIWSLLTVQAAEVHVFDVAVSREPRRHPVLFRPVSKAQDAPPVKAGPRPYQSHSIPPDLLPWNSYEGSPSASELLRSFSQHSGHL